MIKVCENCGKEFEALTNGTKYCSEACASEGRAKVLQELRKKYEAHRRDKRIEKKTKLCLETDCKFNNCNMLNHCKALQEVYPSGKCKFKKTRGRK